MGEEKREARDFTLAAVQNLKTTGRYQPIGIVSKDVVTVKMCFSSLNVY